MTKRAEILLALFARADTLSVGSPALPVTFPEEPSDFDPKTDAPDGRYIEFVAFLNRPGYEGVTNGVLDQGIAQATVVFPRNAGVVAPTQLADEVAAHFAKNTALFNGSTKVSLDREPTVHTPMPDGSEVRVPVTIPWSA
jgi:hypothetical protein